MANPNLPGTDDHILERPFTSPRRFAWFLLALALIAAVAYSVWWFWLASEVREHVDAWTDAMRLDGRDVRIEALQISDYPGPLRIDVRNLSAEDPDGGWRVHVGGLTGYLAPWSIQTIVGRIAGPVTVDVSTSTLADRYTFSAAANDVRVGLADGGRLDMSLDRPSVRRATFPEALTAETATISLERGSIPVYGQLTLDATAIELPTSLHTVFGGRVDTLRVTAEGIGAELPEGTTPASLRAWNNDGGAVDFRRLSLAHGPLGLDAEGTMALDGDLQPVGAFSARVSGFQPAIDRLVAAGVVDARAGAIAKVMLGALAKVPAGGGPKQAEVPLTLQDRTVSVGPVPLLDVPVIQWK